MSKYNVLGETGECPFASGHLHSLSTIMCQQKPVTQKSLRKYILDRKKNSLDVDADL